MQKFVKNSFGSAFAKVSEFKEKILLNMNMPSKLNKQHGMTMTELGVVLALGGVILAVGLALVPPQLAKIRANQVIDALNLAIPNIQTAYKNRSSLKDLDTKLVANQGWIEKSFVVRDGGNVSLNTPWSGSITFSNLNNGKQGQVDISAVPSIECSRIVELAATSDIYTSAKVNNTSIKDTTSAANAEVNFSTASEQCANNAESTITLVFNKG